jgi:hypothetical protein
LYWLQELVPIHKVLYMTTSQYYTEQITKEIIDLVNSYDNDYDLKDNLKELFTKYNISKANG